MQARVGVAVGAAACAVALVVACSFPDVAFDDGLGDAARPDGDPMVDGGSTDAAINEDAGGRIDAAGCAATDCDCDKDGVNDTFKTGCDAGLHDCDDTDPRARPGQQFLTSEAEPPLHGDWNCSGEVEKLYLEGVQCASVSVGARCADISGFKEERVECGKTGTRIRCRAATVGCEEDPAQTTTDRQACR